MFCQECGTQNEDASVFCEKCGARLEKNDPGKMEWRKPSVSAYQTESQTTVRKPMSKLTVAIVVELCLLAAVVYLLSNIGKKVFSPEHVAEEYFVNIVNGNWKDAFESLDVNETEFINAKMFQKVNETGGFGQVTNYQVNQYANSAATGLGKDVEIQYRVKGGEADNDYIVSLIKQPKKKYLFFESWDVGTDRLISTNYKIYVPKGANVELDGISLTKNYFKSSSDNEEEDMDQELDTYEIPQIFYGEHEIVVSMADYEEQRKNVAVVSNEDTFYLEQLSLTRDTQEKLIDLAGKAMEDIYGAAIRNQPLKKTGVSFSANHDYQSNIEANYKEIVEDFNEGSYIPYKIEFGNIQGTARDSMVELDFDYELQYTYQDWSGSTVRNSYQGSRQCEFYFIKEDGNWVLSNLGCTELYY